MSRVSTQRLVSRLVLAAILAGAPVAASADPAPSRPAHVVAGDRVTPADDAAAYAARERQSPAASTFEGGGDSVYIGGSVVAVVLILLLIVIIL